MLHMLKVFDRVSTRVGAACLMAAVSGGYATRAAAHATPHVLDMVFPENGYVLVSNRGLIFGDSQRANWQLMCGEALKINSSEQPSVIGLPGGGLLVGSSQGLKLTTDRGCNWQGVEPFASTSVPELIRVPGSERALLAAYSSESADLGGIYASDDAGKTWQKLMAANERDYVRSIRVAPGDPSRIYATGQTWDDSGKYSFYLASSKDAGKTWERTPVTVLTEDELEIVLFEVHPKHPELITAHAGARSPMTMPERLLVSRDGGKTWSSPLSIMLLSSVAFSADGSKTWVAGGDGLFESTDDLATFTRMGQAESMSYVLERDGQLLVAGYYSGFGKGDNGIGEMLAPERFTSFMQLSDVREQVACDASSQTAQTCAPWWMDWQRELMAGQFTGDAGVPMTAGSDASGTTASAGASGSSVVAPPVTAGTGVAGSAGSAGSAGAAAGSSGGGDGGGGGGGCSAASTGGPRALGLSGLLLTAATWLQRRRRKRSA